MRMVSDVQVKRCVEVLLVNFKTRPKKMVGNAAHAVNSVRDFLVDFPDPADDMPTSENDIIEEDAPWDLRDLSFKDDGEPSAWRRVQQLSQNIWLSTTIICLHSTKPMFRRASGIGFC